MAQVANIAVRSHEFGLASALYSLVKNIQINFARHATYKRTISELGALTDYELNDIGLTRGEIHNVALQGAKNI